MSETPFKKTPDPDADDVHVMPNYPKGHPHAHECSRECWCEPAINYVAPETGRRVWLHKEVQ